MPLKHSAAHCNNVSKCMHNSLLDVTRTRIRADGKLYELHYPKSSCHTQCPTVPATTPPVVLHWMNCLPPAVTARLKTIGQATVNYRLRFPVATVTVQIINSI
jgi:hypothetical protein